LLLLQSQIPQSRTSFQHKINRQTDEGTQFYLKEHYHVTIALYEQQTAENRGRHITC